MTDGRGSVSHLIEVVTEIEGKANQGKRWKLEAGAIELGATQRVGR